MMIAIVKLRETRQGPWQGLFCNVVSDDDDDDGDEGDNEYYEK